MLLDTNILSELRKAAGGRIDKHVLAWAQGQDDRSFMISALTVQEVEVGILLLSRRDPAAAKVLTTWFDHDVLGAFADRVLPYDTTVARACARLHIPDPRPQRDAMIAATALVHNLSLVTRNTRDFAGTGVRLVNPWDYRVGTGSTPE